MQLTPMLGENLANYPDTVLDGKLWRMSEKIDGVRRLFYKAPDGSITAWSRTNHEDKWLTHIFEYLETPWMPTNRVYDCELVDRELYFCSPPKYKQHVAYIWTLAGSRRWCLYLGVCLYLVIRENFEEMFSFGKRNIF